MVQHIEILDATGSLGSTPGTPPSAILVPWNPDDSWKRDALLRVNAVLGAPTRTHTVYEHVDVMVHPLGVNLVESIASSFWVTLLSSNDQINNTPGLSIYISAKIQYSFFCMQLQAFKPCY